MPIFPFDAYVNVGAELIESNPKRYITPEEYVNRPNPLAGMLSTQGIETFFGTQVLNIFVVGEAYGWERNEDGDLEDRWDDLDLAAAIQHHKDTFPYYSKYETHVWIDYLFVKEVEARELESRAREMMDVVASHMEELCVELVDYGWRFMGPIEDSVNITGDFFQPSIDEFMAT